MENKMIVAYNVSWNREDYTIAMSGINYGGMSYIHIPDPSMGMVVEGDDEDNVKNFRLECSIMLSNMENIVLGLSEKSSVSSLSSLMDYIFDGEWFRVEQNDDSLVLKLKDYSEKLIINQTTGVVSVTTEIDGFSYKGAVSSSYNYCYHDELTDNTQSNGKKVYELFRVNHSQTDTNRRCGDGNFLGLSEDQWDDVYGETGGLLTSMSFTVIRYGYPNPYFVGAGVLLGVAGFACNCLAEDVDQDLSWDRVGLAARDSAITYASEWIGIPIMTP